MVHGKILIQEAQNVQKVLRYFTLGDDRSFLYHVLRFV